MKIFQCRILIAPFKLFRVQYYFSVNMLFVIIYVITNFFNNSPRIYHHLIIFIIIDNDIRITYIAAVFYKQNFCIIQSRTAFS